MNIFLISILIIGVFLDLSTSGFLFSVFSLGALAGLGIGFLNVSAIIQFFTFVIVSMVLMIVMVPYIKKKMAKVDGNFVTQENRLIGRELTLEKKLTDTALVNIDGVFWTIKIATGEIEAGEKVKLVSLEGNKFIVEKIGGK